MDKKALKKKKGPIVMGLCVIVFALVGVITVLSLIVNFGISLFDDSKQKQEFESFISPVVMVDPVAFSDTKTADEHVLLMSSMWNLIMNLGEQASYPEDDFGMMIVPASDLDVAAANLFGGTVSLTHQTFGNSNITFEYNTETSSYVVPPMGYALQYQPRVEKIERHGKMRKLTVAYIATNTTVNKLSEESVDKYMYYMLEKIGKDRYIITAVLDYGDDVNTESPDPENEVESQTTSSEQTSQPAESNVTGSKAPASSTVSK